VYQAACVDGGQPLSFYLGSGYCSQVWNWVDNQWHRYRGDLWPGQQQVADWSQW
jgi:hypothetical protein